MMNPCYLFLTTGFEEIEAVATIDVLRRAGIELITVSVEEDLVVEGAHGIKITADTKLKNQEYDNAEILILPGGTLRLSEFEVLRTALKKQNENKKWIAAICAAPSILGQLGIIKGKKATCYPGFEKFISEATVCNNEKVVVSENIITGKGPGCTIDFALTIVKHLRSEDLAKRIASEIITII